MDDYKVKSEIRIDWSEIDLFGHINNLAIPKTTFLSWQGNGLF